MRSLPIGPEARRVSGPAKLFFALTLCVAVAQGCSLVKGGHETQTHFRVKVNANTGRFHKSDPDEGALERREGTVDDAQADRMAPPTHAEMLIRNLVENAVKYALPGSVIRLELAMPAAGLRLSGCNECAVFPLMGERILEPFFRPDSSRNSSTGGNGLGLAICNAIAVAYGWQLTWEQEALGLRVAVVLPNDGRAED